MDYQRIYYSIISKAKQMEVSRKHHRKMKLDYFERHHIIPKCLGGDNAPDNLVLLTAKEHFICHRLLCKIYPNNYKLLYALNSLLRAGPGQCRHVPSARIYQQIKLEYSKVISERLKGHVVSEAHKEVIRNLNLGIPKPESVKEKISRSLKGKYCGELNPNYGKKHSEAAIEKIKEAVKKQRSSTEYVNPFKGKSTMVLLIEKYGYEVGMQKYLECKQKSMLKKQCPHCNKILDPRNAGKYHFDKCKLKK